MNTYYFLLAILFSSCLHAGWGNYWNSIKHGFKSVFSYQYVMRKQQSEILRDYNQALQKKLAEAAKERRKTSNDALVEEISKPGISEFFALSKPDISAIGIFNTSEAAFLMHQIKAKIEKAKEKQSDESADQEITEHSKSEKCPRIIDSRELPDLGKYEHNNNMSKYLIYFSTFATNNNHAKIQISLIERMLATKRMRNKETGLIEDVPVSKKQARIIIIGTENDNGGFSWEKITNDMCPEDATPKEAGKVAFNESANRIERFARWNYSNKKNR